MIDLLYPVRLTEALIGAANIAEKFSSEDLRSIGRAVLDGYAIDKESRSKWEKRNEAAHNLALQLQEPKTFPWPNASNVKFPLVTIAAIQWHSRAYPLLIQGPDIVKARTNGPDPEGKLRESADRVSKFMSYQLLEDSPSWEEETDRALLQVPIVGCVFKKTYYSALEGRNVSELVPAKDFVLNYWAKSVATCPRKTHIIPFSRNDIHERVMAEVFCDVLDEAWFQGTPQPKVDQNDAKRDKRTGLTQPSRVDETTPFFLLEQHVRMDLDGDGYAEPYIIVVEETTGCVCRVTCNFSSNDILWADQKAYKIVRIRETQYFTKFTFIPSPDGGIYDVGFGTLLGPLNQAVDSLINQLVDAGTLATTAGGFLGRGVKIRGGEMSFRPFGWNRVDSTGEDLHKGIFPFPVRDPSNVLFQLLSLLVDYTNRISGSTDIMVGENPGQNTPAETSRLMAEQGAKINSAIFKRIWRGFKEEFQKLFLLNRLHTPVTVLRYGQDSGWVTREDFMGPEEAVRPAADPNLSSDTQRVQQALMVKQQSMSTSGYNKDAVERNLLRAMKVEGIESLFPGSDKVPPLPNPKVQLEQMKGEVKGKLQEAQAQHKAMERAMELQAERPKIEAEINLIQAEIAQIIAEVGEAQAATQVKAFEARINAAKALDESYRGYIELLMKGKENAQQGTGGGQAGGGAGGMVKQPGHPGP
jgi:chaperonin GroES